MKLSRLLPYRAFVIESSLTPEEAAKVIWRMPPLSSILVSDNSQPEIDANIERREFGSAVLITLRPRRSALLLIPVCIVLAAVPALFRDMPWGVRLGMSLFFLLGCPAISTAAFLSAASGAEDAIRDMLPTVKSEQLPREGPYRRPGD